MSRPVLSTVSHGNLTGHWKCWSSRRQSISICSETRVRPTWAEVAWWTLMTIWVRRRLHPRLLSSWPGSTSRTAVTCSPLPPAARHFPGWASFSPRPPRLSKGPELVDYSSSRWGNPSLSCRTAKVLKCLASLWVASTEIPSRQVVTLTLSTEKDISPGKTFTSFLTSQSEILFLFLLQIFLYTSFEE